MLICSDQYYSVQTTEAEQILQVIAGYIDIIVRKQRAKDHLGIEGDEGSAMLEDSVSPSRYPPSRSLSPHIVSPWLRMEQLLLVPCQSHGVSHTWPVCCGILKRLKFLLSSLATCGINILWYRQG